MTKFGYYGIFGMREGPINSNLTLGLGLHDPHWAYSNSIEGGQDQRVRPQWAANEYCLSSVKRCVQSVEGELGGDLSY
jgi:hypothetical protein